MKNDMWLWLGTVCLVGIFCICFLATRETVSWPILFGNKQVAMFDLWSLQHAMSGVLLGWTFRKRPAVLLIVFGLAYSWESAEWWLESGGLGAAVAHWKAGHEHWANRLIADPACVVLGARLSLRYPRIVWPVAIICATWFIVNVLAPDCMYVQRQLGL